MLSLKMVGMAKVTASLKKKYDKLTNKKPAIGRCVVQAEKWVQVNFRTQGKNVGGWKTLEDSTIYARRHGKKKNNSTQILQDVGYLRDNWKHYWDNDKGFIQSQADDYGIFHDKGGRGGRPPKRRILPKQAEMWPKFKKIFNNFIRESLK